MNNMITSFYWGHINDLDFLIFMSNIYWNKFCRYTDIWVGFLESKDNFSCFIWQQLKVAFKSTIFWCWIWALIDANHFYNLELIQFKSYSTPTCISIPLSNLGWLFQKISITYNLGQNCWDKIENLCSSEKSPLPPNQCCWQRFRLLTTKLAHIQHWYWGARGRIWNLKNWVISWIY